jgi:hypothetical protein
VQQIAFCGSLVDVLQLYPRGQTSVAGLFLGSIVGAFGPNFVGRIGEPHDATGSLNATIPNISFPLNGSLALPVNIRHRQNLGGKKRFQSSQILAAAQKQIYLSPTNKLVLFTTMKFQAAPFLMILIAQAEAQFEVRV